MLEGGGGLKVKNTVHLNVFFKAHLNPKPRGCLVLLAFLF